MESTVLSFPPRQAAKTAVLLGLALYFLYVITSGNLSNYINYRFAWLAYVATAILALLGVISAWDLVRAQQREGSHSGRITWTVLGVLALPLLLGVLIPSRPLGAEAISGSITTNVVAVSAAPEQTGDPLTWNVLDWLRSFNRSDNLVSFNGSQADVIGFVYREPSFPENMFMVARFTVSCCVADAGAIGLPVYWPDAPELTDSQWVRVQGAFQMGDFRGGQIPVLQAGAVTFVEQPEHPYLYP